MISTPKLSFFRQLQRDSSTGFLTYHFSDKQIIRASGAVPTS
jgi:hypothetical protein